MSRYSLIEVALMVNAAPELAQDKDARGNVATTNIWAGVCTDEQVAMDSQSMLLPV
jgi:hypothetical protein